MAEEKTNVMRLLDQKKVPYVPHQYDVSDGALDGVTAARRLRRATRMGAVLCCLASGLGMLLCAYLVSVSAYGSLSPLNLLVYMLTWLGPVWFLSGWVHRF